MNLVARGVDVVSTNFPILCAEMGLALVFPLRLSDETRRGECVMSLKEAVHRVNAVPLVEECTCQCCARHTRAYVHHLLNTHEMLAQTLLALYVPLCASPPLSHVPCQTQSAPLPRLLCRDASRHRRRPLRHLSQRAHRLSESHLLNSVTVLTLKRMCRLVLAAPCPGLICAAGIIWEGEVQPLVSGLFPRNARWRCCTLAIMLRRLHTYFYTYLECDSGCGMLPVRCAVSHLDL